MLPPPLRFTSPSLQPVELVAVKAASHPMRQVPVNSISTAFGRFSVHMHGQTFPALPALQLAVARECRMARVASICCRSLSRDACSADASAFW